MDARLISTKQTYKVHLQDDDQHPWVLHLQGSLEIPEKHSEHEPLVDFGRDMLENIMTFGGEVLDNLGTINPVELIYRPKPPKEMRLCDMSTPEIVRTKRTWEYKGTKDIIMIRDLRKGPTYNQVTFIGGKEFIDSLVNQTADASLYPEDGANLIRHAPVRYGFTVTHPEVFCDWIDGTALTTAVVYKRFFPTTDDAPSVRNSWDIIIECNRLLAVAEYKDLARVYFDMRNI